MQAARRIKGAGFEPHVHGLSELTIAMEGKALEMQLISPSMNLIAFEHKASTKKDIDSVKNAESLLGKHDSFFSFAGGSCTLITTSVDVSSVMDSNSDGHEHEHEHEHEDNHVQHDNHSEIIANYHYNCEDIAMLSSITVDLFDMFSGINQIHAMWITEKRQGAETLSAENKTILLR